MRFDKTIFLREYAARFGRITPDQSGGLLFLLEAFEKYWGWWDSIPQIGNAFAQIKRESAHSFLPVVEGYYLGDPKKPGFYQGNTQRVKNFQKHLRYYPHFGMGHIQVTHPENFEEQNELIPKYFPELVEEFEKHTGKKFDLVKEPAQILDPWISFAALTIGMHKGTFTGQTLDQWITPKFADHYNARGIVNGDKNYRADKNNPKSEKVGAEITRVAKLFIECLNAALIPGSDQGKPGSRKEDPISHPEPVIPITVGETAPEIIVPNVPGLPDLPSPPPGSEPVDSSAVIAVPQAKPEYDPILPQDLKDELKNEAKSQVKTRMLAIPGLIFSWAAATVERFTSGESSPLIYWLFGIGAAILIIFIAKQAFEQYHAKKLQAEESRRDEELKRIREDRAHEITKLQMMSAMRSDLQTVQVVPIPLENSDSKP